MKSIKDKIMVTSITIIVLATIFVIGLAACNAQVIDTTYKYNKAYILLNGEWTEVKVVSWRDYDASDSIQIKTTDGKTYYTHLNNVVLIAE